MKPLPIYIPVFISLFTMLLPKRTAQACGFYVSPGEYRFWLLQPDLTNEPDLTPFYFASGYLYKDMNAVKETYREENIGEWFRELKGKASKADIDSLLNATDPQYFFDEQKALANENGFLRTLQLPQNSELYRYLILSKKVEQISGNPDPWEEDGFPNNNNSEVIAEAHNLYKQTQSPFVKLRIAYQLTRLYAYNFQPEQVSRIYDQFIDTVKTNSWIKTAALYQKTFGVPTLERNYWLSKVFDRGNYHKTNCLVRFTVNQYDSTLLLAKNEHEKNVILAMKAFNYPGRSLHILKGIYASEPGYKELSFLLLREVNKVEDWLVTNNVTDFGWPAVYLDTSDTYSDNYAYLDNAALNYKNDKIYAKELLSFIIQMIHDGKNKQQPLLHLYASHVYMILKDYKAATQQLQLAKAFPKSPQNVRTQIQINTYLLHLEAGFPKATENEFMHIIQTPAAKLGIYDADIMKSQLVLYTANKMIKQNDRARGLMLLARTNRALGEIDGLGYKDVYEKIWEKANDTDYDEMLQILGKKKKSPFERFIVRGHFRTPWERYYETEELPADASIDWSKSKLLDSKASWYIRNHRLEEALATMQQIPDSVWHKYPYDDYLAGDPFFLNVYAPHAADSANNRQLTKKQAVEEMIQLQQLAKNNKRKAALCYYKLGNAWYNMSWHGKSWLMVKRWKSMNEESSYNSAITATLFNDDYYGCRRAKEYYSRAMAAAKDKKLSALCYLMMEQCDHNYQHYRWLTKTNRRKDDDYPDTWNRNYKQAAHKGIDVSFYQSLVQECELYQSFIQRYNKRS